MFNFCYIFIFSFCFGCVLFSKVESFVLCLSFILGLIRFGYIGIFFLSRAISFWFCGVSKLRRFVLLTFIIR